MTKAYDDIVEMCSGSVHPAAVDASTVVSAMGEAVLPKVDPPRIAAVDCITIDSRSVMGSPADSLKARGSASGNMMPMEPMAEPVTYLRAESMGAGVLRTVRRPRQSASEVAPWGSPKHHARENHGESRQEERQQSSRYAAVAQSLRDES